jgi:hypothetical protein
VENETLGWSVLWHACHRNDSRLVLSKSLKPKLILGYACVRGDLEWLASLFRIAKTIGDCMR